MMLLIKQKFKSKHTYEELLLLVMGCAVDDILALWIYYVLYNL